MWLIDTNVLSELRRPKPQSKVLAFIAGCALPQHINLVTLAEIRFGIEFIDDPTRRAALNDWLIRTVRPMFDQRVLPITEEIMLKWRLLLEDGRKSAIRILNLI
jgi:predicted nucleic acid-binding protein